MKIKKRRQPEHAEQVALFQWARLNEKKYPELKLMFAIPNGGARHPAVAAKLQAEGVRAGIPDIFLPVLIASNTLPPYDTGGLFIEMKSGKNRPTPTQEKIRRQLEEANYQVAVCYSWVEAKKEILNYLARSDRNG